MYLTNCSVFGFQILFEEYKLKKNTLIQSAFSIRQRCCLLDYLCYVRSDLSSRAAVTVMVKEHIVA